MRTKKCVRFGTTAASAVLLGFGQAARAQQAASADHAQQAAPSSGNIETVVVTGTRPQATDIKKQAPVILDISSLEQIRSLPDANAAEALQRLPGISMESDSGEGRFINIRGMDADLNGTTFDGVRMMANNPASPQGGARAVAFDAFPAGLLGGVEVIKTLTPEIDAEGLGGVVNIQPRTIPAGQEHLFDSSFAAGVETLRNTRLDKGDVTVGRRFDDDKLSVIFSYAFQNDDRGIDDIEGDYAYANDGIDVPAGTSAYLGQKEYDDVQYRRYQYHRRRKGYGAGITFSPSATSNLYLRGFHAGYTEEADKHEFVLADLGHDIASIDGSGNYDATQATAHYVDINTKEKLGNDLVELGGNTLIDNKVQLDARLSWTQGYDRWPYSINTKFYIPNPLEVIYNNSDASRPTYRAPGVNLADPALYTTATGSNSPSHNTDTEHAGVVNVSFPLASSVHQAVLKFGASLRQRSRKGLESGADLNPVSQDLSDYVGGSNEVFYHDTYDIGPEPDYSKLLTIPQSPLEEDPSTYEDDDESVSAGYAQYSATLGKLDVVGGLRVESTDGTYRANTIETDTVGNTIVSPASVKHSYTNVFPDISFRYSYSDALQLRFGLSTAIARPGFNQITAARSIDLQNAIPIVSQGNPDLKPTIGRSVDLYASYFLPNNGIVSGGLFYKSFRDYISTQEVNSTNVTGFVGQTVDLTTYQNIGSAHVEGLEAQYNQQFVSLPGALSGLGFEGNVTLVKSRGEIRPGETHELPQTSPFNYNAGIYYSTAHAYFKLAASYVSTNLWVVGGDPSTDQYSQPRSRLDFGGTYDITPRLQAYFDVKNITNTHLEFTYTKSKDFPIQNEFYDPDYLLGIRANL